jgi:uncharacterized protein YecT (DUF1311 family)
MLVASAIPPANAAPARDRAERVLAAARHGADQAIAAADTLSPDERAAWASAFDSATALWLAFRDTRCEPRLIGHEIAAGAARPFDDAVGCTQAITGVIADDIGYRYELDPAARPRASATRSLPVAAARTGSDDAGPCADVDPGECDYCGANRCWEARLARDDRALNRVWAQALLVIRNRQGLAESARADWVARLRASQRAWLAWRDAECALEPWETPNRFAHSIYSTLVAPCLDIETQARIADLRASYGLRRR